MFKSHPSPRRQSILYAIEEHARGHIAKHIANVDILLDSAVGVAEHADVIKIITDELDEIAHYQDQLDVIAEHFKTFRRLKADGLYLRLTSKHSTTS